MITKRHETSLCPALRDLTAKGWVFLEDVCGPFPPQPSSAEGRTHGALASFPSLISISLSSLLHGDRLSSLVDLFG